MKLFLSFVLCLFLSTAASAQVLAPVLRLHHSSPQKAPRQAATDESHVGLMVEVDSEDAVDALADMGAIFWGRRGDILLALIPIEEYDRLNGMSGIRYISSTASISATMDVCRPYVKADRLQAAPEGLTGKGVTVGFSDVGFDPSHPAFRGRVRALANFNDLTGTVARATTPAEVSAWTTDNDAEWHATHVGGILCGGDGNAPQYRGIATGSSLVACTSRLTDVAILAGVEEIIASAKAAGEPAVINLSISSSMGPHDGTSAFCRYLDMCAEDAVITISAGNSGKLPVSLTHTFSADAPTAATMLYPLTYAQGMVTEGYQDFWSSDARPVEVRLCVYDRVDNCMVWTGDWITPASAAGEDAVSTPESLSVIEASLSVAWEVNPANGRFNMLTQVGSHCDVLYTNGTSPRYLAALDFRGPAGMNLNGFTDGTFSLYRYYSPLGALVGPQMSVNDMATGFKTLCVGGLITRNSVSLSSGSTSDWSSLGDGPTGQYTSYGHLADGRSLPQISAPGAVVVAPISSHFLTRFPAQASEACLRDSEGYYYAPNGGTSMASPMVAGVCALWLEAAPWLTPADVIKVACATADPSLADPADPRSGAGCIDAAAGLQFIRNWAGGVELETDGVVTVRRCAGGIEAVNAFGEKLEIEIFDLSGRRLHSGGGITGPAVVKSPTGSFTPRVVM